MRRQCRLDARLLVARGDDDRNALMRRYAYVDSLWQRRYGTHVAKEAKGDEKPDERNETEVRGH